MDKRLKNLKISFPKGWLDISNDNPDGPPTFINEQIDEPGVLQISVAEYQKGEIPTVDYENLISLSETIGQRNEFGLVISKQSGDCRYGKYGSVQFTRPDFPYIAVWHLFDGKSFVMSTFICSKLPDKAELKEVEYILTSLRKNIFFF